MGAELFKAEGGPWLPLDFHLPDAGQEENTCTRQVRDLVFWVSQWMVEMAVFSLAQWAQE